MMSSDNDVAPFSWPAFGAGFNQPYAVHVTKEASVASASPVYSQLKDLGVPGHDHPRALSRVQPASGKSFEEIPLTMEVVIGQAQLPVSALMSLTPDQVIYLNKRFGEPVEVRVNGQTIGRGEIVADHHENIIGIRLIEVLHG